MCSGPLKAAGPWIHKRRSKHRELCPWLARVEPLSYRGTGGPPSPPLAVPPQSMNLGASTEMPGSSCVNEVNLTQNEVNGLRDKELSSFYSVITNHPSAELLTTARVSQGQPGSQGQNYVKYYIYTGLLQVYNYTTVNRCCLKFRV